MEQEHQRSITEQAAEWLVANRDQPDPARQGAFVAWLQADPAHAQAYSDALRMNSLLYRALTPAPAVETIVETSRTSAGNVVPLPERPTSAPPALRSPARRRWLYAAAAAAVPVVGLLSVWMNTRHPQPPVALEPGEHFATGHGQQLAQSLADGTVLHLNTDTAVTVHDLRTARWVEIEHGQVEFDVMHDPARPFRVTAGSAQVVDVGTRFDVYLQGESTLVTVVEGRVTVGPSASAASSPMLLTAGEQVRVVRGALPPVPVTVDAARTTAWLHRQISFRHEPLGQVAQEFNRYSATPIQIDTPGLGDLTVSGVFNVDDTDSMVAFLRSLEGVTVEVTANRIRVSRG